MVMQSEFESIAPYVTAVSLMTYDFSHPQRYCSVILLSDSSSSVFVYVRVQFNPS